MRNYLLLVVGICVFIASCSDPSTIGAGLLQNEELIIDFTDAVPITAKTVVGDSVKIISSLVNSVGIIDDPIFGKTENQLYISTSFGISDPDFTEAVLDSIVLTIRLNSAIKYGDSTASHHVQILQLDENLLRSIEDIDVDNLFSFVEIPYNEMNVVGEKTFVPNYRDTNYVEAHLLPDTLLPVLPSLRLRIDNSFADELINMPDNIADDTLYQNIAKGFLIRSTPSASSMMGLDFSVSANHKLKFYYTKADTIKRIYDFDIARTSHLNVKHDQAGSGSEVELAINDSSDDQEYLYLESYDGANIEFDLSAIKAFDDKIINNAVLELTIAELEDYNFEYYPPIINTILSFRNEQDNLQAIQDVSLLQSTSISTIEDFFGGDLRTDETTGEQKYLLNITKHLIDLQNDPNNNNYKIVLTNFLRSSSPRRSIIYGHGSEGKGPTLNLVITTKP